MFKKLELEDKPLLDSFFKNSTNNNAEKNFSNLFMWRHTYKYEYALIDECLCIKGKTRGDKKTFYHFPYGSCEKEVILSILEKALDTEDLNFIIKPLLPQMKECLENYTNSFEIIEDRDSFDYIYTSQKLIELKSSKLRTKRHWVEKFKGNYDYSYEEINKDNIDEAKSFTLNLIKDKDEFIAMAEMFDNFFDLNIKGCIVRVDSEIVGVSTGEELTEDTVLIHCERASKDYEGIYNFLNQEFVKRQWADFKYINREEDMGLEGLRKAKLSYRPDELLVKYVATLI